MNATTRMATVTTGLSVSYTPTFEVNLSCNYAFLEDECDLTILLSTIMFYVTIFNIVLGVIANFLVIGVILGFREMRTIPSIYIASLAVTDIMVLVFVGGLNCQEYYIGAFQPKEVPTAQAFVFYMELVR